MTHPERARDYLEHIADAIERARRYAGRVKNLQGSRKISWFKTPSCAPWP